MRNGQGGVMAARERPLWFNGETRADSLPSWLFSFIHAARLQHRAFHGQSTSMSCDDLVTSLRRQKNRVWTATTAKFFSNPLNGITDLASRCGLSLEGHLPLCPKTRQDACQGISLLPNAKPVFPCSRCCCSRSPVALPAHQALSAER